MALPTCECVKGLPIGEQLAAIYCATYTLAAGDGDGPYLLKSANLSDVDDPDAARGNISAAESGDNTDITSLSPSGGNTLFNLNNTPAKIGDVGAGFGAIWFAGAATSSTTTNYAISSDGNNTHINANSGSEVRIRVNNSSVAVATADGLTPSAGTYPKLLVYLSANYAITGSFSTVPFDTELVDTANAFSGNAFTVPANAAGVYLISVKFTINQTAPAGGTTYINIVLSINGADVTFVSAITSPTSNTYRGTETVFWQLNAGDVVRIRTSFDAGSNWQWDSSGGSSDSCRWAMNRVF